MGAPPPGSQVVPLPKDLPFRLISKTIGSGAYASIRKAVPVHKSGPIIAIKFINREHAFRVGHLRPKQIQLELAIHKAVCPHANIIRFLGTGDDENWIWLAMELAEGGDLFDKIEADEGVPVDVAHLYFTQLVEAVGWCHGKGVAHRDIKPENMLLSERGDLKLADFGLATQFVEPKTGVRKKCGMVCGSPPYIAPEILEVGHKNLKRKGGSGEDKAGYDPDGADVWSCAIVLFVLLAGNTPWDSPVKEESWEYLEYLKTNGRPADELWDKIPIDVLSLVRGMLKVEPEDRMGFAAVRKHPWFRRHNPHVDSKGRAADPVALATKMLEHMRIDFEKEIPASQQPVASTMDLDVPFAATQPETPIAEQNFDWEAPVRLAPGARGQPTSLSQPANTTALHDRTHVLQQADTHFLDQLSEDPSMSQFTATPTVPLTHTQAARKFKDIMPSYGLAHFLSKLPPPALVSMLLSALHRLSIPLPAVPASVLANPLENEEKQFAIRIKTLDSRKQVLHGSVTIELAGVDQLGDKYFWVRFLKAKGDPVGWRRLFKSVTVLCREGVMMPRGDGVENGWKGGFSQA